MIAMKIYHNIPVTEGKEHAAGLFTDNMINSKINFLKLMFKIVLSYRF